MKTATTSTAQEKCWSTKAKPWWTRELSAVNKERSSLRKQQQAHQAHWGSQNEVIGQLLCQTTNYFCRLFKHKKKAWVDQTLEEATPYDVWGFCNWSKGTRNYPSPAIKHTNQNPVVQYKDKCNALQNVLFQPHPPLANNDLPNIKDTHLDNIAHIELTKTEVQEAIYCHCTKKAPGESQQTFVTIRWAWEAKEDIIFALMHHCIQTGHHSNNWH
ncbi:hypothetical protein DXG03_008667 [Asterophora parasitica]|uniref:Uncharacterized protein n=1 Tax=Asterophora parasitica TaxID=117018 RepID=A0A9P7K8U0_9AGAR|nr:hypothetical protein DXG03_008667 [Asterophora parasitica]